MLHNQQTWIVPFNFVVSLNVIFIGMDAIKLKKENCCSIYLCALCTVRCALSLTFAFVFNLLFKEDYNGNWLVLCAWLTFHLIAFDDVILLKFDFWLLCFIKNAKTHAPTMTVSIQWADQSFAKWELNPPIYHSCSKWFGTSTSSSGFPLKLLVISEKKRWLESYCIRMNIEYVF